MRNILKQVRDKLEPIEEIDERIYLNDQKSYIDEKIRRFERKEIDTKCVDSLRKVLDVKDAVSEMQHALNIVWKRIQQIEEDLKSVLDVPHKKSVP